jgi:hypothetical protein
VWTKPESNDDKRLGAARLSPDASIVLFVVQVYREEVDGEEITRINPGAKR